MSNMPRPGPASSPVSPAAAPVTREAGGATTGKTVGIAVLDDLDAPSIHAAFRSRFPEVDLRPADSLAAALEANAAVVAVLKTPEDSLAACLAAAGEDVARALSEWTAGRRELLSVQRRNRHRLTLIDVALLAHPSDPAWPLVARRLGGASLQAGSPLAAASTHAAGAPFLLAAVALSRRDAAAAEVTAELAAAMIGPARPIETNAVLDMVRECRALQEEAARLRGELAAHSDLAGKIARDDAQAPSAVSKLEERLQAMSADRDAAIAARNKAEQTLASLGERMALLEENLTLQLDHAEGLERLHALQIAELRDGQDAELQKLRVEAALAEQMVQAERVAREGAVRHAAEAQARRDAVLGAQLLADAQAAAIARTAMADLQARLAASEGEAAQLRKSLTEATQARDRLTEETEQQKAQIEALSQELDRVYGSASWRLTAPLRAAHARVRSPKS